jgi:hypothetical protein
MVYRRESGKAVRICPGMDGISQRAREGGANMSRDGRYIAKSQGCRCEYVREFFRENL